MATRIMLADWEEREWEPVGARVFSAAVYIRVVRHERESTGEGRSPM